MGFSTRNPFRWKHTPFQPSVTSKYAFGHKILSRNKELVASSLTQKWMCYSELIIYLHYNVVHWNLVAESGVRFCGWLRNKYFHFSSVNRLCQMELSPTGKGRLLLKVWWRSFVPWFGPWQSLFDRSLLRIMWFLGRFVALIFATTEGEAMETKETE